MNRWAVALRLVPATLLMAAIVMVWQTEGVLRRDLWVPVIMAGTIFLVLAIYASQIVSRVGRAILVSVALCLDTLLGFYLWFSFAPDTVI